MSNKVPQIRFNGYSDAWEERKLGDEFKKVSERNDGSFGRIIGFQLQKCTFKDLKRFNLITSTPALT